jgi:hypothetical protein
MALVRDGAGQSLSPGLDLGAYRLQLANGYELDARAIADTITTLSEHVDLAEPFARIREAIREAQRIGGRGNEFHDQAA